MIIFLLMMATLFLVMYYHEVKEFLSINSNYQLFSIIPIFGLDIIIFYEVIFLLINEH